VRGRFPCIPGPVLRVIVGAALALAAGCGGSGVPEGEPISVRIDVVQGPGIFGNAQGISIAQPLKVDQSNAEWARVSRLLPDSLPEPVDQGSDCVSGGLIVSVRLATRAAITGEVDYGPCRWPEEIEPVRLLMHTLLRRRLAAERRCDCP
jgi:hypothetical protein